MNKLRTSVLTLGLVTAGAFLGNGVAIAADHGKKAAPDAATQPAASGADTSASGVAAPAPDTSGYDTGTSGYKSKSDKSMDSGKKLKGEK